MQVQLPMEMHYRYDQGAFAGAWAALYLLSHPTEPLGVARPPRTRAQMLAWRAEAPKHREFDPNMMTEVYHAAIYIDASETGRLAHLALSAKGGANKYTWGRQERWGSNSWQGAPRVCARRLVRHAPAGRRRAVGARPQGCGAVRFSRPSALPYST